MHNFHHIDVLIIIFYIITVLYLGIFHKRKSISDERDFILSGRKLSMTGFVATLVTTWYGAILGIGENTFLYGIQTWFIWSSPYYIFALGYAFLIAPKIREKKHLSIPDHFRETYGEKAGILSALIISFLSSPAPYILSMGLMLQFLFQIQIGTALFISTIFSVAYVWNGGFSAVVKTDYLQFILMFTGFFLLLYFLWIDIKNPILMLKELPYKYLDPMGGNTFQYLLVWFFIASWTFIDPGFFQRCAAAESPASARNGILIAIIFWMIFDCLTITCALYGIGIIQSNQASLAFPLLAIDILPYGFFGIFIAGIVATLMSTIDSFSLLSAISFGRDILWRIQGNKDMNDTMPYIKKGILIISTFSMILAYFLPSIVLLFYVIGSVLIPGLILPFLNTFRKKKILIGSNEIINWMSIPMLVSIFWYAISSAKGDVLMGLEPFYPGMFVSVSYYIWYEKRGRHGN